MFLNIQIYFKRTGSPDGNYIIVPGSDGSNNQLRYAYLSSEIFSSSTSPKGRCLTFWYYITGSNAGSLSFYVQDITNNNSYIIWKNGGADLGIEWNYGSFGFYFNNPYTIRIVSESSTSARIIALDDLIFQESKYCAVYPSSAMAGTGLPLPVNPTTTTKNPITSFPSVYDCNFETNFCNWNNDVTRKLMWTRNSGSTSSYETGPTIDHT